MTTRANRFGLAVAIVFALSGCAARTSLQVARDLDVDDVGTRRDAAETLDDRAVDGGGLPHDVMDIVLHAAAAERDPEVRGKLMLTLGHSGDMRAKPVLDAYARTDDPEARKIASQALQAWAVGAGRYPKGHVFEKSWPYGTETYPK